MGDVDKLENDARKAKGKVKQVIGDLVDDESLETEGRTDEARADIMNAGESLKEAARKAKDAFTE